MNKEISRFAISVAVAKRARQIMNDALIHGILLDYNAVERASKEFKDGKYEIIFE